jgi:hypothetical protein
VYVRLPPGGHRLDCRGMVPRTTQGSRASSLVAFIVLTVGCGRGGTHAAASSEVNGDGRAEGGGADGGADADAASGPLLVLAVSRGGGPPLVGVVAIFVALDGGGVQPRMTTYPLNAGQVIDDVPVYLGLQLADTDTGMVSFTVEARDAAGCALATDVGAALLRAHSAVLVPAPLLPSPGCGAADAGADADGSTFAGCDPVASGAATGGPDCDPRTLARDQSGCPKGLTCALLGDLSHATCTCFAPGAHAAEGEPCSVTADCGPNLVCTLMAASRTCRAICRCDARDGACSRVEGECPVPGKHCEPLTNSEAYGVCGP